MDDYHFIYLQTRTVLQTGQLCTKISILFALFQVNLHFYNINSFLQKCKYNLTVWQMLNTFFAAFSEFYPTTYINMHIICTCTLVQHLIAPEFLNTSLDNTEDGGSGIVNDGGQFCARKAVDVNVFIGKPSGHYLLDHLKKTKEKSSCVCETLCPPPRGNRVWKSYF